MTCIHYRKDIEMKECKEYGHVTQQQEEQEEQQDDVYEAV